MLKGMSMGQIGATWYEVTFNSESTLKITGGE